MEKGRIMIVEDERFSATVLQKTVERLGYEVVGNVQSGKDAIELFKKELPDVMIMDFNIQGDLDGSALAKILSKIKPTSNIFITASEDEESLQKIMDAKPDAYIQKPFEQRELRAVLEMAFYKYKKEKELNDLLTSLDKKVKERTQELDQTVKKLVEEVAEREKVQQRLEESLKTEKKFGELKSSIISNLSHEFKTPLSAIRSSAQFLSILIERQKFEQLNTKHPKRIEEAVSRLADILTRILLVEENVEEIYQVNITEFNIAEMIQQVISELKLGECKNVSIAVDSKINDDLIKSDAQLLKLILSNILSNACKYSKALHGEVFVNLAEEENHLTLTVSDNGIGMTENDVDQIFYRFYRGSNVGSIEGTGIGMSIMKRCLDALGGKIEIDSKLGEGSSFKIKLPMNNN